MSATDGAAPTGPVSIRPAVITWLVLTAATALSWWLGSTHEAGNLGGLLILSVAFLKVFLVGNNFMEIRAATPILRLIFSGWCAVTWAVLTTQYLAG